MAWIKSGFTPSLQRVEDPEVGGLRGTTIGPLTPAGAAWIWAAVAGAMFEAESSEHTRVRPTLSVIRANPLPSGSPPRISSAPELWFFLLRPCQRQRHLVVRVLAGNSSKKQACMVLRKSRDSVFKVVGPVGYRPKRV